MPTPIRSKPKVYRSVIPDARVIFWGVKGSQRVLDRLKGLLTEQTNGEDQMFRGTTLLAFSCVLADLGKPKRALDFALQHESAMREYSTRAASMNSECVISVLARTGCQKGRLSIVN